MGVKLTLNEYKALTAWRDVSPDFDVLSFAAIERLSGLPRRLVRRTVRSMARKGVTKYVRGAWTDEGQAYGSGYGLTDEGHKLLNELRGSMLASIKGNEMANQEGPAVPCEACVEDHVQRFWQLLASEHVRITVEVRRGDEAVCWDSSSFTNDVAKALVDERDSALRAVFPEQWTPCTPEWLEQNPGQCGVAPRVWSEKLCNHLHPVNWNPDNFNAEENLLHVIENPGIPTAKELEAAKEALARVEARGKLDERTKYDAPALIAARKIMELTNSGKFDDRLNAKIQRVIIGAMQRYRADHSAPQSTGPVVALPPTGPFVDRLVRIFRDRPHDDSSAVVLRDYAISALTAGKPEQAVPSGSVVCPHCSGTGKLRHRDYHDKIYYGECHYCHGLG